MLNTDRRDRGATAITVAITLVLLMGMAAVAIDLGLGFNERRQDQTGADTGVMAGAVEVALGGSIQEIVKEITDFVDSNIRPLSIAEWEACTDSPPPGFLTVRSIALLDPSLNLTPETDCISFFKSEELRVRVPDQEIDTSFGRVIGIDSLTTSAVAHARITQFPGEGNSPPFVALANAVGGQQICLRTGPVPLAIPRLMTGNGPNASPTPTGALDPCDESEYDPDSQFFGTLDPLTYYNNLTGAVTCKPNRTAYAIAAGIDHPITDFEDPDYAVGFSDPLGPSVVEDDCSPVAVFAVNTMALNTGLAASDLRCGLLTSLGGNCSSDVPPGSAGGDNVSARLHLGPYFPSGETFVGEEMDNKPLWDFLANPSGLNWPGACTTLWGVIQPPGNPAWEYFDKKDELISCLTAWVGPGGPYDYLFTDQVITTPRFAWIPWLAEVNLNSDPSVCPESGGTKCVHFNDFKPVYLQTLYTLITGPDSGGCDSGPPGQRWGRHDAGEQVNCGKNNGNVDRLSSIVLECGMLPEDICVARPGFPTDSSVVPKLELIQ